VSPSDDENREQVFRALSEAGLVEIRQDEFPERLSEVKRLVVTRLRELLDFGSNTPECESAAYSLGTLKGLELELQASSPRPDHPKK
jgi:hypothetical protein